MKHPLSFTLSHTPSPSLAPIDRIPASVPGAVQLDYAAALRYPPYFYGLNYRMYDWMEDEFFVYETILDFSLSFGSQALLRFEGIDYRYEIDVGGQITAGEGAFTPVRIDVSAFSGKPTQVRVTVFPIPKRVSAPRDRCQASASCKPPSSYGWDWHPRLVPSGLWKEAYLQILPACSLSDIEASYRLTEDLSRVTVTASAHVWGEGTVCAELIDPEGQVRVRQERLSAGGREQFSLTLEHPALWYPRGYGDQPRYTLRFTSPGGGEGCERRIGFRRAELILNEGAAAVYEADFPKGPSPSPMQLRINGQRVFAKGSNFVGAEIFPALAAPERYRELIDLAVGANMNLFRLWGGQYIPQDVFYDLCDETGVMVWQEFPLSCNAYPDDDAYLAVLEQEAASIIRALRTHPCLAMWCGGNELFNSWSGMTNQAHALRLLDALCYEHDRFTPFQYTSPTHGVSHGTYTKAVFPAAEPNDAQLEQGEEYLVRVKRSKSTAYTEFGCSGGVPQEYLTRYVMSEEEYEACSPESAVWRAHHAFGAWGEPNWLNPADVRYYFGSYDGTDDLIEKSIYLQDMCYQTMFEEMRRQAPLCSMAVNWDFNEPWPCAAGNSLVRWPAEPKSCLTRVGQALRPTLLSLESAKNRWRTGEVLTGTLWVLNDSAEAFPGASAQIWLVCRGEERLLARLDAGAVEARENGRFGSFSFEISEELPERFAIEVRCAEREEISSRYTFVHRR